MKDRIAEAVESTGLTNVAFAKRMGKSKGVVTQWLDGRIKSLKAETAQAMQDVTGYRSEWLISGRGEKLLGVSISEAWGAIDTPNGRALPAPTTITLSQALAVLGDALAPLDATARRRAGTLLADLADDPASHASLADILAVVIESGKRRAA